MWVVAISASLAVLFAGGHAAGTRECAGGDGRCVVGADHALLATKVQVSKMMVWGKEHALAERSRQVPAQAPAQPQPIPPVSTTMKCVISVTILYFVVYTSLFVVACMQDITGEKYGLHDILEGACETVVYAPMISVLFIGTRMRAIAVTRGDPDAYGLPQWWCKDAMVLSSCCVFVLTFISIVSEALANVPALATVLSMAQYVADAFLYAGFACVAYGLYTMDTPPQLGASTPVSDTAKCVMYITLFYFVVAIMHQCGVTYDLLKGPRNSNAKAEDRKCAYTKVMHHALEALNFAPQICVLFLGARMRALQLGYVDPQPWVLHFCFAGTYALFAYSILSAVQHAVEQGKAFAFLESICLFVLHLSTTCVIVSVFTITAMTGETPLISTTVRVIMGTTVMYFFVHTLLFTCEQLTEYNFLQTTFAVDLFEACKESVMFVPMMCALFLGTRMRALQLSHNTGAPQGWAQDCMMLATWAIFFDLLAVICTHLIGNKDNKPYFFVIFQAVCLTVLHFSTTAVIASIFLQTVENTSTNGADQLIDGITIPGRTRA